MKLTLLDQTKPSRTVSCLCQGTKADDRGNYLHTECKFVRHFSPAGAL